MLWLILITVLFIYVANKIYKNVYYWELKGIKHVKLWPLGQFGKSMFKRKPMVETQQDIYEKYPDAKFVGFYQIGKPTLMIRDPEVIKQIKVKCFENFSDHTIFVTEEMDPLIGKNIFSLKGQRWKDMRSTLSPAFTSSKMRKMYILIKECAEQFTKNFLDTGKHQEVQNQKKMEPAVLDLEMFDIFQKYTIDTIATCAFGITSNSIQDETNEFYVIGKKISTFTFLGYLKVICFIMMPKLMSFLRFTIFSKDILNFFRNIIKTTMDHREKNNIIRPDMIHLLMEARKGQLKHEVRVDEDAGFATVEESQLGKEQSINKPILSDDDITAQAVLFFLAGYDTTSTMMSFLAYELALNPDIQKKLQEEIDTTLKICNGNVDYESLLKMKYLDMVICESLRKWPPAPLTERLCTIPYELVDKDRTFLVEKEKSVLMPIYSIHHDKKYFPNPGKFDPERFSDENKHNIAPFTYLPFGAGPRNCIGSRFALLEIKELFTSILSKFDLVVTEKTEIPLKLNKADFTMKSENGIWLGLKRRT